MIIQTKGDVVKLKGSLTENQWPSLRSAVSLLLEQHPTGVVIDASGLTEISEAGARTFLEASNFIQAHNARVVVAGMPDEMLAEIRKIPGVRSQLVVAASIEEARASLESGGAPAYREGRNRPTVLVPLVGAWIRALDFSATQAAARRADLVLLYVLQIPRNLPLGVPVPEMEQEAQRVLSEAERALKRRGVHVQKVMIRARDTVDGAAKYAAESEPELVVLAYFKSEMEIEGNRCAVLGAFCHESPRDVALLCATD